MSRKKKEPTAPTPDQVRMATAEAKRQRRGARSNATNWSAPVIAEGDRRAEQRRLDNRARKMKKRQGK